MHTDRRAHRQEVMIMLRVVVVTVWLSMASAAEVSLTSVWVRASLCRVAFSDTGRHSAFYPPSDSAVYNKTIVIIYFQSLSRNSNSHWYTTKLSNFYHANRVMLKLTEFIILNSVQFLFIQHHEDVSPVAFFRSKHWQVVPGFQLLFDYIVLLFYYCLLWYFNCNLPWDSRCKLA